MFLFKYIKYILNCIEKAILPAKKGSRQRALCHLPLKAVGKEPFATCQKRQSAKSPLPPVKKGSRQRAPSFHDGVRSLCRLPYWQVAKALPTAFLLAGGKGFFTDEFFATCSLLTATCKAVGKAFATYFRAFADCFWQSAKNRSPVVYTDCRRANTTTADSDPDPDIVRHTMSSSPWSTSSPPSVQGAPPPISSSSAFSEASN